MDLDPVGIFRDDSNSETEFYQDKEAPKKFVAYLIDASPKMFNPCDRCEDKCSGCKGSKKTRGKLDNEKWNILAWEQSVTCLSTYSLELAVQKKKTATSVALAVSGKAKDRVDSSSVPATFIKKNSPFFCCFLTATFIRSI